MLLSDRKARFVASRFSRITRLTYGVGADLFANPKQAAGAQLVFHNALPQSHFRFFRYLRESLGSGDFFFVHAGVKPDVDLAHQTEKDLLWIRHEFRPSSRVGKIIIHGHTPTAGN